MEDGTSHVLILREASDIAYDVDKSRGKKLRRVKPRGIKRVVGVKRRHDDSLTKSDVH